MRPLTALVSRLAALTGWRRAVVAGGLGVWSPAPRRRFTLPAILAFSALPWLLTGAQNGRAAFAIGWWFGFGMLTAGLYWISNALLVDSARHLAGPRRRRPAGSSRGLLWRSHLVDPRAGPARRRPGDHTGRVLGHRRMAPRQLVHGFPMEFDRLCLGFSEIPLQATAFIGSYGLGLVTLCMGLALALLGMAPPGQRRWYEPLAAVATLALLWAGGSLRLAEITVGPTEHTVRVVQGNVAQRDKWQGPLKADHIARYLAMTTAPGGWPPPPPVAILAGNGNGSFLNEAPARARRLAGRWRPTGRS